LTAAKATPHADLAGRISTVTTADGFAAMLGEFWPKGGDAAKLEAAFMAGLFEATPGGARLLEPHEVRAHEQLRDNRYEGTGIQVHMHKDEGLVQIRSTFPRSPARRAGMKAGDFIVAVDGEKMQGKDLATVVRHLRGVEGEPVAIVVRQPGEAERELKMIRGVIPFEHLVGRRRTGEESWDYRAAAEAPVAYVRVTALTASALHELRQLERRLQAEGFRALVLDLRLMGGGDLSHAALVADAFLDGGVLWRVQERRGASKELTADRDCLFRGWPLAVLIGEGTSGVAPQLLAAALKDNGRAILVGRSTRGLVGSALGVMKPPDSLGAALLVGSRGYVEGIARLPDGGAVLLATAKAERAKPTDEPRVTPHHEVALPDPQRQALFGWYYEQERSEAAVKAEAPPDAQLARAVEILKAAMKG
jgi:carboxyl-terminal processing protease